MPVYEYKCTVCEEHMDIEQSFADDALTTLKGCEVAKNGKHKLKKVFSAVGISFKGDGFYRNDARSGSKASTTPSADSSKSSSDSSDSSTSSTKTETSSSNGSSDSGSKTKASSTSKKSESKSAAK